MTPLETLRAAAEAARRDESLAYALGPLAAPLADLLDGQAEDLGWYIAAWDHPHPTGPLVGCASGDPVRLAKLTEDHSGLALRVARVLLGVPDGPR